MDPTRATAKWRNVSRSHWIGGRMEVHWSRQARTVPCCPFEATPPSIGQSLPRIHVGFIRYRAIVNTTTGVAYASQAERNSKPGSRQPQLRSLVKSLSVCSGIGGTGQLPQRTPGASFRGDGGSAQTLSRTLGPFDSETPRCWIYGTVQHSVTPF